MKLRHCALLKKNVTGNLPFHFISIIMTNFSVHYKDPVPLPALGKSDHVCILWRPKVQVVKHQSTKRTYRPMKDSQLREFGVWIQDEDWSNVLSAENTQQKADALFESLRGAIDRFFPMQTVKVHHNNKPWMLQKVKDLLKKRQVAFKSGKDKVYNKLHNKVQREIKKANINFYANRVRILQQTNPRKWHQQIKSMTGNTKSELGIPVQGVSDDDHVTIANTINDQFVKVSFNIPLLILVFLRLTYTSQRTPTITLSLGCVRWAQKGQIHQSNWPRWNFTQTCERICLWVEFTINWYFKLFLQGVVPKQWKQAVVVPIPKTKPPRVDKLGPVSLTDCSAKIGEGFVTNWVLEDIQDKIEPPTIR